MKAIVVGAGGATRDLLGRLGDRWDVTVVDVDPSLLAAAGRVRPITPVQGDGSSRVVLDRAGLADADVVVAATGDDSVNLETCRIAREAGMVRVAALAISGDALAEYRKLQIPAVMPDGLAARILEQNLMPDRVPSTALAGGRAEAVEFRITPESPVRGRSLQELHSETWLVAAVMREGRLIVPRGDTVLTENDVVTVVGAGSDYSEMVRVFTAAEGRFPLDFGKRVAVVVDEPTDLRIRFPEAVALTRDSHATSTVVVHRDPETLRDESRAADLEEMLEGVDAAAGETEVYFRPVPGIPQRALRSVVREESIGVVVLAAPAPGPLVRARTVSALHRAARLGLPVLFSRGSNHFGHIVVPGRGTLAAEGAVRAAIDIAEHGSARVTAVAAIPQVFRIGADGRPAAERALTRIRDEAGLRGVEVRPRIRQGSPARVLEGLLGDADLLVIGMPSRAPSLLQPGIVGHLVAGAPCSVLVVPAR